MYAILKTQKIMLIERFLKNWVSFMVHKNENLHKKH